MEEGVQSQIPKKNRSKYLFLKNYAKFIILKNSRQRSLIICLILCSFINAHEHRFVKLAFIDRNLVIQLWRGHNIDVYRICILGVRNIKVCGGLKI